VNHLPANRQTTDLLQTLERDIDQAASRFIGFPAALDFDYTELSSLLQRFLNNIGDPASSKWIGLTTKAMEREVLAFFADLFRAPSDSWWGYVTNGSTECNLYAMYAARQRFPDGVMYFSNAAHYSVPKNAHILDRTPVVVNAQPSGEMDYTDLAKHLAQNNDKPAIIIATVGTTMTEARDNIQRIIEVAKASGVPGYHIHVDAALAGPYAALLEPRTPFDFEDGADSVGTSGHKFIGSPMPCGVIIIRREHQQLLAGKANYTGSVDTTISGSRNGHTPLILWYALQQYGKQGLRERAEQGMRVAAYTYKALEQIGWESWRNPNALTVMLRSPSEALIRKWQLASTDGWSHIICMPGVTEERVDAFIRDLKQSS